MVTTEEIRSVGNVLNNKTRPLKERFRALFTLKNVGGVHAIKEISRAFDDDSALLKHELAYCLGQMRDTNAINILTEVLRDKNQEPMVRHEAAEALGAIGVPEVIPILKEYENDPVIEVAETCNIALDRVFWLQSKQSEKFEDNNPYASVDPSPPTNNKVTMSLLRDIYLDTKKSLFERYRALFSLRNMRTEESTLTITEGLHDPSALFRHEVAFVLGQLQDACAIPHLKERLEDKNENEMVRHECAEALGAIATKECIEILNPYLEDGHRVVKESCEIALDMCDYANSPEFQYANSI